VYYFNLFSVVDKDDSGNNVIEGMCLHDNYEAKAAANNLITESKKI